MRLKIFPWLGQEFVSLSWENSSAGTGEEETRAIFELFSKQLKQLGLSLDHTVRTRMFTLDMETFNVRAQAKGIRQATDLVVMSAAEDGGSAGQDGRSSGVELSLLHHPTGQPVQRHCDWVVCAVHQAPEDELWQELQGAPFEVHRVGDCVTPRRAHAAVIEGHRVAVAL